MSVNLITKIINNLRLLIPDPWTSRFIDHNRRVFPFRNTSNIDKPIVLMEFNTMHANIIASSYLANVLGEDEKAVIKGFMGEAEKGILRQVNTKLQKLLGGHAFGAYSSFGAEEIIEIDLSANQRKKARDLFVEITERLVDKRAIENLIIRGVWVGDLIYDTYLRRFIRSTINLKEKEFQDFLLESLELFIFWEDYFKDYDIRAVNISHCAYNAAIPYRLAIENNIPAYQVTTNHLYQLSKSNYFAYSDYTSFREKFSNLPEDIKKQGLESAQKRIQRRFGGEVAVDMPYSTKSAWGLSKHDTLLRKSTNKKILVATHCFYDSPHGMGLSIFPDFYEWLEFLGKITEITDYDWYIKTHPDYRPETMDVLQGLIERYPKFKLLPSDASHHQIIEEGIDVALTVFGTIGFEYAALGIPVVNCSKINPHIDYNFNIHPKDEADYRDILLNLDSLEFEIDRQEVYEYYFMQHLNKEDTENLFFNDSNATIAEIGGDGARFTPIIYEKWLAEWTEDKHQEIISSIRTFTSSSDYRMGEKHFKL